MADNADLNPSEDAEVEGFTSEDNVAPPPPYRPENEEVSNGGEDADKDKDLETPPDPKDPEVDQPEDGEGDDKDKVDPENPDAKVEEIKDDPAPKDKARQDFAERKQRKSAVETGADKLEREELEKQSKMDPNDPDTRIARLESNDRIRNARAVVSEVRTNQQVLRNDHIAVQKAIPMFREKNDDGSKNPDYNEAAYNTAFAEFATYLQETNDENPEDREILGAFDPKTGEPVSFLEFMKTKATQYGEIAQTATIKGQEAERKMRNGGDMPGSGGIHKDKAEDPELEGFGDTGY